MAWSIVYRDSGGSASLSWDAPTTNDAGQTFDNSSNDRTLVGYKIYGRVESSGDPSYTWLATTSNTSVTISGLSSGNWWFYLTAYDGDGTESAPVYIAFPTVIP